MDLRFLNKNRYYGQEASIRVSVPQDGTVSRSIGGSDEEIMSNFRSFLLDRG